MQNGEALKKFEEMISFQGVDLKVAKKLCYDDIWSILKKSENSTTLKWQHEQSGTITHIDALKIGKACVALGAGRTGKNSKIDTSVGINLLKTVGDIVTQNDEWIQIHHKTKVLDEEIKLDLENAIFVESDHKRYISKIIKIVE